MDFTKLSDLDLQDFLSRDYSKFGVQVEPTLDPASAAQKLFDQLKLIDGVIYPLPVIDLYLASNYLGPRDQKYTSNQILDLTVDNVNAFDQLFNFNANMSDLQTNRDRIFRILSYLNLIVPEEITSQASTQTEDVLYQMGAIENICQNLSYEEINNLRLAKNLTEINCRSQIDDPDNQIESLPRVNDFMTQLYHSIKSKGSQRTLLSLDNLEAVRILLSEGVDPIFEIDDTTPLLEAVKRNDIDLVSILLQNEADPNLIVEFWEEEDVGFMERPELPPSPLGQAVINNQPDIISILIRHGADPNLEDHEGSTPLMIAVDEGLPELIPVLVEHGADVNHQNSKGITAAHYAVVRNNPEILDQLIQLGANIIEYGATLLNWAIGSMNPTLVSMLTKNGADPNSGIDMNQTPLIQSVEYNQPDIVRVLLQSGANPNLSNFYGQTPLHLAANLRHNEIISLLLQYQADINQVDKGGETPLMKAAIYDQIESARFLLENRANPNIKNRDGRTAFTLAREYGNSNLASIISSYGGY